MAPLMRSRPSRQSFHLGLVAFAALCYGGAIAFNPGAAATVSLTLGVVILATLMVSRVSPERIGAVAACVSLGALIAVPILRIPHNGSTRTLAIAIPLLCAVLALTAVTRKKNGLGVAKGPLILAALYFVVEAFSTSIHSDPSSWRRLIVLAVIAVSILTTACQLNRAERLIVLRFIAYAAVAESLLALWEVAQNSKALWVGAVIEPGGSSRSLFDGLLGRSVVRAQGTFGHPLPLSYLLVIGFVVIVAVPAVGNMRMRTLCGVLIIGGCLASGSRSAIVLLGVAFVLGFGIQRSSLVLRVVTLGVVALIAALLVLNSAGFTEASGVGGFSETGSVTHRVGALESISRLTDQGALTVAVGNGSASTPRLFRDGLLQSDGLEAVDNQFVLWFAQVGLIGTGILLAGLGATVWVSRGALRLMMLMTVTMLAVFDLADWPAALAIATVVIGMVVGSRAGERSTSPASFTPSLTEVQRA
jgi:hypothetical protein